MVYRDDKTPSGKTLRRSPIYLAIVGSRLFEDVGKFEDTVQEWIKKYGRPTIVISGGAHGADEMAKKFAEKEKIEYCEFSPDWKTLGKSAGLIRNSQIVDACTHVLAFPMEGGKGTQDTIKKAKQKNKHVTIHWV